MSLHYIKLEIVTPVHIGVSDEKKLSSFDFFVRNSEIGIIDWDAVFSKLNNKEIKIFTQVILNEQNFEQTKIRYINSSPFFKEWIPFADGCVFNFNTKINTHIRDGLGKVYIPGSSLKGAIISVYYSNFARRRRNTISSGNIDLVFGSQENSPLRLFEVTDAYFHPGSTKIYPAKIYSLRRSKINNFEGGWKDQKHGSTSRFNNENFINLYECFDIGKEGYLRIKFNEELLELNRRQKISLRNEEIIFEGRNQPIERMFKLINSHTHSYLNEELDYFNRYRGDRSEIIIRRINVLIELVNQCMKNNCALLHLGSGSGFHGITGDWRFDSHIITGFGRNGRGQINGRDAAKTRRLIFEEKDGDYVFYPMGFVKLSISNEESYQQFMQTLHTGKSTPKESNKTSSESVPKPTEVSQKNEPRADIPIIPYTGKIKQGIGKIPAEVIESGKPNKVRIFIKDYTKNDVFVLRGVNNPIEKGIKLFVKLGNVKKDGEILDVSFQEYMNK